MEKNEILDRARALWIYQTMNEIRCFEEKALSLFEANRLRGLRASLHRRGSDSRRCLLAA